MKGKIVAIPFLFTNLSGAKVRPALVIYEGHEDVIVAFISSKIPVELYDVDVLITDKMACFKRTGLKTNSVIQLNKLATIDKSLIEGEFGEIDSRLKEQVRETLIKVFDL
jgi:mRNA interferase MazF